MLPSIQSLSNPISALARLIYINDSYIDVESLKPKTVRPSNFEFLIEQALKKQKRKSFIGVHEKMRKYMDSILSGFCGLGTRDIVLLGFYNKGLRSNIGFYKHVNTDDFCSRTDFAPTLIDIHDMYYPKVQKAMQESILWYRMGPAEFPFIIMPGRNSNGTRIVSPFSGTVKSINISADLAGKSPLGDFERYRDDDQRQESYNIAETVLSITKFHEQFSEINYIESLHANYQSTYSQTQYSLPGIKEFQNICESAIMINREIMKQKYSRILKEMGAGIVHCYFTEGNVARDIVSGIKKQYLHDLDVHVIGEKLLKDTKYMPANGQMEAQALNRLSGWLNARYGVPGKSPVIINAQEEHTRLELHQSTEHQYIYAGEMTTDIDAAVDSVPDSIVEKLERDIKRFQVRISPIEVIIYFLNENNFPVTTDSGVEKTWHRVISGSRILPYKLDDIKEETSRIIRPSNTSQKCEFSKYLSIIDPKTLDITIKPNRMAVSGELLHKISNTEEFGRGQEEFLLRLGLTALKRSEYCEIPIVHRFTPTQSDYKNASDALEKRIDVQKKISEEAFLRYDHLQEYTTPPKPTPELELYSRTLDIIKGLAVNNEIIVDGGKFDAMAVVEDTGIPIVIDFKRRVDRYYPVKYFFEQTARYGLALLQAKNLEVDRFYTVIVQTPFTALKSLEHHLAGESEESESFMTYQYDRGHYRHQKIRIKETIVDSDFVRKIKADMIIEYAMNTMFKNDVSNGMLARKMYKSTLCERCFSNTRGDFKCHYVLTGEKRRW